MKINFQAASFAPDFAKNHIRTNSGVNFAHLWRRKPEFVKKGWL